jgi:phosphonate degradation associated HDIG domain protein
MDIYKMVADLFNSKGDDAYIGEEVSQREHALQAAHLADKENAGDDLIVAALVHDIGHLLVPDEDAGEQAAQTGIDTRHENVGEAWLLEYFPPEVTEPVRLHVDAKRYLCATQPDYVQSLSPASQRSLELQGGAMTAEEIAQFESNRYYKDAVKLRLWDDTAKVPGLSVPPIKHYRARLIRVQRGK